jgi:Trypsin
LHNRLQVGQRVVAVGYGLTERGTHGARLMGDIPILSVDCVEGWYPYLCAPFAEMLLVDRGAPASALDTCPGDSGGPVYLPNSTTGYELIGVVSRAARFPQGPRDCGGGGVYELIGRNSVIKWLAANVVPDTTIRQEFGQASHTQVAQRNARIPDIPLQPLFRALRATQSGPAVAAALAPLTASAFRR